MSNQYPLAVSTISLKGKIPSGDPLWPKFNASFKNEELTIHEIMDVIYYGNAITTQHKNNWRTVENYLKGGHIGLDFDTEDKRSTITELKRDKFISKYAAFIHTTPSHTDEKPRARVIFVLDRPILHAKNYALSATALLWLFGSADAKCKDAVRFFYGSKNCNMDYIGNVLPLPVVLKTIQKYQESGERQKKRTSINTVQLPATMQEVQEALQHIPPWGIEYDEWVNVLMGIHSQFGDAGYQLAESWGQGKEGEVEQKFRSFKQGGNGIGTVTIATVFKMAKDFGWSKT